MTSYKKIFIPAGIYLAVLTHVVLLFRPFRIASPSELEDTEPEFTYIEAVVIKTPPPAVIQEPEITEPDPFPEPVPVDEPPPEEQVIAEPVSDAVEIGEEADEKSVPDQPVVETDGRVMERTVSEQVSSGPVRETPEPEEKFIPFYRVEKRPKFIYRAPLEYPLQARRRRVEGVVIIEADIDKRGRLVATRVEKEEGFGFEEAAIAMLEASRFSPAIIDGRAVGVRMRFTIEFRLN